MLKINPKIFFLYLVTVILIFILDRFTKIYILSLAETNNLVDIYVAPFLNLYLIWNKGIAFGFFSFEQNSFYNFITILIIIINLVILIMIMKINDIKAFFLSFILGGSFGNLFDRIYYSAVPDFIDFHINDFHWFIFNVADVFISVGVVCLIIAEFIFNKISKNEKN